MEGKGIGQHTLEAANSMKRGSRRSSNSSKRGRSSSTTKRSRRSGSKHSRSSHEIKCWCHEASWAVNQCGHLSADTTCTLGKKLMPGCPKCNGFNNAGTNGCNGFKQVALASKHNSLVYADYICRASGEQSWWRLRLACSLHWHPVDKRYRQVLYRNIRGKKTVLLCCILRVHVCHCLLCVCVCVCVCARAHAVKCNGEYVRSKTKNNIRKVYKHHSKGECVGGWVGWAANKQ